MRNIIALVIGALMAAPALAQTLSASTFGQLSVITDTQIQNFPHGTTLGSYGVTLLDSTGAAVGAEAKFTDLTKATVTTPGAGSFSVRVQAYDGAGNALGAAKTSNTFVVADVTTVPIAVPFSVIVCPVDKSTTAVTPSTGCP